MFQVGDLVVDPMKNGKPNGYNVTSGTSFVGRVLEIDTCNMKVEVIEHKERQKIGNIYHVGQKRFIKQYDLNQTIKLK